MKSNRFLFRLAAILLYFAVSAWAEGVIITRQSAAPVPETFSADKPVRLAVLSSPKVIGKYSQNIYDVSVATLLSLRNDGFDIKRYTMPDESAGSISDALDKITRDGMNAILAPLTENGARNFASLHSSLPTYIPTVHKRELPDAPDNIVFGGIDYQHQIEALVPYMADSIAIFYDNSAIGNQLKSYTEAAFINPSNGKRKAYPYPVDTKGDNIISYLAKPSLFNKKSIILHIPVVKSSILTAHLTFSGIRERNILSTQINVDPSLLTLTQYQDRRNMILANSLVEFPGDIYEMNALMNNNLAYDWVLYSTSVGIDYLVSSINNTPREYTLRVVNHQVIYPVELVRAKEFGFEPL